MDFLTTAVVLSTIAAGVVAYLLMNRSKRTKLMRRELPLRNSFTAPHVQSYRGAKHILALLEDDIASLDASIAAAGGSDDVYMELHAQGALERQSLSEAVQVLSAMTVEGATNLLGVLVVGEDQFQQVERMHINRKLKQFVKLARGKRLANSDELLVLANRLVEARNGFVHPKPQEGKWRPNEGGRRADVPSARAAIADAEAFLAHLSKVHHNYAPFFLVLD